MLLLRHNRLSPPFHDYAALTADMLDSLAIGTVSPDIAPMPEKILWADALFQKIREADFFVCSGSNRTQQTCHAVMKRHGIEKRIIIDDALNEIFFIPSKLMDDPSDNPLEAVRKKLFSRLLKKGEGVEALDILQGRMDFLLEKYKPEKCVLFSHGFLMRLVSSYCLQARNIQRALADIDKVGTVDYLGSIEV
jgi:broad specificity phosphatase PhoE